MEIYCPHCEKTFPYHRKHHTDHMVDIIDDRAVIEDIYVCPHCKGSLAVRQESADITMWYSPTYEAL